MLRVVGVDVKQALLNLPMTLQFPDGPASASRTGQHRWMHSAGILGARGWSLADKGSLLRAAAGWQLQGFQVPGKLERGRTVPAADSPGCGPN